MKIYQCDPPRYHQGDCLDMAGFVYRIDKIEYGEYGYHEYTLFRKNIFYEHKNGMSIDANNYPVVYSVKAK